MKLAEYLDSLGQADFVSAQQLGVTHAHLSKLRSGTHGCSLKLAVKIEQWSGGAVTPADLLPVQEGEAA